MAGTLCTTAEYCGSPSAAPLSLGRIRLAIGQFKAEDGRHFGDCLGQSAFIGRQLRQRFGQRCRKVRQLLGQNGRRGPVRRRKQDVDAQDARMSLGDPIDKLGNQGPRPRPLAIFPDALIIDLDDPYRRIFAKRRARQQALF